MGNIYMDLVNMKKFEGITLLGLGCGDTDQLTREAWNWLSHLDEVHLRTRQHPTVAGLPAGLVIHSFDELVQQAESLETAQASMVERILELGKRPGGVTYAVPGNPMLADAVCAEIARRVEQDGIALQIIAGVSFLEPTLTALGLGASPQFTLVDALELAEAHHPVFSPSTPTLIWGIHSHAVAARVINTLSTVYPRQHPVRLVHAAGTANPIVEDLQLGGIDHSQHISGQSLLYVPPLSADGSFEAFQELIAHLRAPEGCPWDRKQTHQTLRTNLLEETYEVLSALDANDPAAMQEEFGDLLLQIVLHAQIASEYGEFTMEEVIQGIHRKLVRRHPHVFGDVAVSGSGQVIRNWEKIKENERKQTARQNGAEKVKGLLDGVPVSLPALSYAQSIQDRARRVGFDWSEIEPVIGKVREELDEVLSAPEERREAELGDLLFAVVNLARWYKVDAETALRLTGARFRKRFSHIEERARESGKHLSEFTLQELDVWWDEAKRLE